MSDRAMTNDEQMKLAERIFQLADKTVKGERIINLKTGEVTEPVNRAAQWIASYSAELTERVREETLEEAAEVECDYCGGRAWDCQGKEIPFQAQGDARNWYHRIVSPCKAAPIHNHIAELKRATEKENE